MITQKQLKELLRYNENNGEFYWLESRGTVRYGSRAGAIDEKGYIRIRLDGKKYRAHKLVWLYMTGEWPKDQIDHKDLDKSNNRWDNIRPANNSQNNYNRDLQVNNTSGYRGVSKFKGRYRSIINVENEAIFLGYFDTAEEANQVYQQRAKQEFGEFYHA